MLKKIILFTVALIFADGQTWAATSGELENCKKHCPQGKAGRSCKKRCKKISACKARCPQGKTGRNCRKSCER